MSDLPVGARLPVELVSLVQHVTADLGEAQQALMAQVRCAVVTEASATNIDAVVPPELADVALPSGPTPGRALVYDGETLLSEVMVWIRGGRFIGLEQPWYTDEPPDRWPDASQIRLMP